MSGLHQAVTRAIRDAHAQALADGASMDARWEAQAAAAIREGLAEAQRAVEALPRYTADDGKGGGTSLCFDCDDVREALAALAALAEDTP